jgi:flagellar biosynthetic protein FliQ
VDAFDALLHQTLAVVAIICLPVLAVTAAIGTLIAIAQAATQVQEQTLPLLPKICAVGLLVALGGRFALALCAGLFDEALARIPLLVTGP